MVQPDSLKKWAAGLLSLGVLAFLGWRVVGSRNLISFLGCREPTHQRLRRTASLA